jgi:hypothetical protein
LERQTEKSPTTVVTFLREATRREKMLDVEQIYLESREIPYMTQEHGRFLIRGDQLPEISDVCGTSTILKAAVCSTYIAEVSVS